MNILIFVISMLTILSLLTYGRVESFRNFSLIQDEFKNYMKVKARVNVNELAGKRYDHTHVPSKYQTKPNYQNSASSTLSFNLFIDKEERKQHLLELAAHRIAAKNLMYFLYGHQEFFKKIEEKRPQILDEILDGLIKKSDEFKPKDKINRPQELATIDLDNEDINLAFTYMLQGYSKHEESEKAKEGYPSLLNFITVKRKKLVIRVFLASQPLLVALFGSPDIVKQISESRNQLYKEVKTERKTIPKASEEFKNLFINKRLPSIPDAMLNFDVSGTNPAKY
jgi:hypothetical protein